jgi:hypothetical protein
MWCDGVTMPFNEGIFQPALIGQCRQIRWCVSFPYNQQLGRMFQHFLRT